MLQAVVAQRAGAAGLIVVNSNNTGFFNIIPDSSNAQVSIPVLAMPRLPAIPIFRSLLAGSSLSAVLSSLTHPSGMPQSTAFTFALCSSFMCLHN